MPLRISVVLNVLLAFVIAAALVWKFTGVGDVVRNVARRGGLL